jgi:hypothetical protein
MRLATGPEQLYMDRIRIILFYFFVGLSFVSVRGQQIANYIRNGDFEECLDSSYTQPKFWTYIDTMFSSYGCNSRPNGNLPYVGGGYQYPRSGYSMVLYTVYCDTATCGGPDPRIYTRNRLKATLNANTTYCVKFHVNIRNNSTVAIDALGVYFGDNTLDTITIIDRALPFLTPQIENASGNFITDTLGFTSISGSFVAVGTEKYAVIGNFKTNASTNTILINPSNVGVFGYGTDIFLDDVSCIEMNLPAYAGPDIWIDSGDSVFIGRQPDWALDNSCTWYLLPNLTTAIDTVSGLWVKPSATSSYVVRQELDCGSVKWDTAIVSIKIDDTGLERLRLFSDNITLAPNPTSGHLRISFGGSVPVDMTSFFVTNSLGQLVLHADLKFSNNSADIETSDLAPGLYQIQFRTSHGTVSKKFVRTV